MKKTQLYRLLVLCVLGLMLFVSVAFTYSPGNSSCETPVERKLPLPMSTTNDQFIDSLLDNAIVDYTTNGYFSSYYQPTLQASYQAISTLDAIGGLSEVDVSEVAEFIMNYYTPDNRSFIDITALRYLDADFSQQYYPLQTHMEVTCYAVLTLDILEELDQIDTQKVRDFIWSCYQPVTSGFIGQPYAVTLAPKAKIATLDNVYYALLALDVLGFDWNVHGTQKTALVNFIGTCQEADGGFFNDKDFLFDSLETYEPGLLSSFFAIRSLVIFDMLEVIRINDFKEYLTALYDTERDCFSISEFSYYTDELNYIASSIGLELSDIVSFTGIDRPALLSFVLNGRNALGGWSSSSNVQYHELIDTFQVVRSIENAGEINNIPYQELVEISHFVALFRSQEGYAPLSSDYQAISQLNVLATSFRLMDRVSDLPLQFLYDNIESVLFTFYTENGKEFGGTTGMYPDRAWFRSYPIEFASRCAHDYIPYLNAFSSIKWTSLALETLEAIYKLDDLYYDHDLTHMLNGVINSQFLDDGLLDIFGSFMNSIRMVRFSTTAQAHTVFLENAYHAVHIIDMLSDLLGINQTVSQALLDPEALVHYIAANMVETDEIYFQPRYGSSPEDILEHTYQALYILRELEEPDVSHAKILTYIENHIDYDNLKSIYFCYKIKEFYGLEFDFDIGATQSLVQVTYNPSENNFFVDTSLDHIDPRAFGWVIEMAKDDDVSMEIQKDDIVYLGGTQNISVSIGNLVLEQLGTYVTVKFHSALLGTRLLAMLPDGSFSTNILIPNEPEYYPLIEGNITVYNGLTMIKQKCISFQTTYDLITSYSWENNSGVILVTLTASQDCANESDPLLYGTAYGKVYKDDTFLRTFSMTRDDESDSSDFSFSYVPLSHGSFVIELFLNDGYDEVDLEVGEIAFDISSPPDPISEPDPLEPDEISMSVGMIIGFLSVPGVSVGASVRYFSRKKHKGK